MQRSVSQTLQVEATKRTPMQRSVSQTLQVEATKRTRQAQMSDFLQHMYMEMQANAQGSTLYPKETQSALTIYQVCGINPS